MAPVRAPQRQLLLADDRAAGHTRNSPQSQATFPSGVTFAVKNGDAGAEFPRYPCRAAPKRRTRSDQGWLRSDQLGAERRFYFGVTSYRRAYAGFKGFGCGTAVAWSWDLCTGLPEQPREERAGKVLPKFCLALHIQVASLVLEPIRRTGYIGTC